METKLIQNAENKGLKVVNMDYYIFGTGGYYSQINKLFVAHYNTIPNIIEFTKIDGVVIHNWINKHLKDRVVHQIYRKEFDVKTNDAFLFHKK